MSVFWVHASSPDRFYEAFAYIAQKCQIPGYAQPNTNILLLVKDWLEKTDQRKWLMVIDSADDLDFFFSSGQDVALQPGQTGQNGRNAAGNKIGRYLPECSHGSILVTTRNKQAGIRFVRGRARDVLDVGEMDAAESGRLVKKKLAVKKKSRDSQLRPDQVSLLTARLENIPLALVQATAFMQANSISIGQYLDLLGESDVNLVKLLSQPVEEFGRDSAIPNAITATWMISFDQLRDRHPEASKLLSLMSFFDRQGIPKLFLPPFCDQDHRPDSAKNEALNLQTEKALGILKAFSFISEGNTDQIINLHRLIQLVMRKWLAKQGTSQTWASKALQSVSKLYPQTPNRNWEKCQEYLPHAYAVLDHDCLPEVVESPATPGLMQRMASFQFGQGQYKSAETLLGRAMKISQKIGGKKDPATTLIINNLGLVYWHEGEFQKAKDHLLQALTMQKRITGPGHPDILTKLSELALICQEQDQDAEAEALILQAIRAVEKVLATGQLTILDFCFALAVLPCQAPIRLRAESLMKQMIAARIARSGPDHPETLNSMDHLLMLHWKEARWRETTELCVRVTETRLRVLGASHLDTIFSMARLGEIYVDQGRWGDAEEVQGRLLRTCRKAFGEGHFATRYAITYLAGTWRAMGRGEEADGLMEGCVPLSEERFGRGMPATRRYVSWRAWRLLSVPMMLGVEGPDGGGQVGLEKED